MSTPYERPTDELRQVEMIVRAPQWPRDQQYVYVVQRKWLVQDGELYCARMPKEKTHINVPFSRDEDPYGSKFPRWTDKPLKAVWRDLPIVTEKEAAL